MCLSSSSRLTRAHSCDGAHSSEAQQEREPQHTNAFQTFSHIMAVNVLLAKGSHEASLESVWESTPLDHGQKK